MASDPKTVAFIVEQAGGDVSARPMFGEYGLYREAKFVALVCDDQLFVKPTAEGRAHAPDAGEGSPYPGAKAHLLIDAERWDDGDWLADLFRHTADALPMPRPRAKKAPGAGI